MEYNKLIHVDRATFVFDKIKYDNNIKEFSVYSNNVLLGTFEEGKIKCTNVRKSSITDSKLAIFNLELEED